MKPEITNTGRNKFEQFPQELREFAVELFKEFDVRILKAMLPPNQVILDDLDVMQQLHVSKRKLAYLREEGLIGFSKPCGKNYSTLQDVLDYAMTNYVAAKTENTKNDHDDKVL